MSTHKYLINSCPNTSINSFTGYTVINSINDIPTTHLDSDIILVADTKLILNIDEAEFDDLINEGVTTYLDSYDILYGFKWLDMCDSYTTVGYSSVNPKIRYVKSHSPNGLCLFVTKYENIFDLEKNQHNLKSVGFSPLLASFNVIDCITKNCDINKASECKSILSYKETTKNYLTQDMLFFWIFVVFLIVAVSIFLYNIIEFNNINYIMNYVHNKFN